MSFSKINWIDLEFLEMANKRLNHIKFDPIFNSLVEAQWLPSKISSLESLEWVMPAQKLWRFKI